LLEASVYNPVSVPNGPHHAYIFQDQTRPWFKIGISRDPDFRRKQLCWDIYGARSLDKIKEYRRWTFANYFGALHVEQAAIGMLKSLGLAQVRSPDWFETDQPTMNEAIESVDRLTTGIISWEEMNASTECIAARPERPYGAYLVDTKFRTLQLWYESEPGCWTSGRPRRQR